MNGHQQYQHQQQHHNRQQHHHHHQQQRLLEQHQRILEQQQRCLLQQCSRRPPAAATSATTATAAEVSSNPAAAVLRPAQPPPKHRPRIVHLDDEAALSAALTTDGYRLGSTVGHGSYSKVRIAYRTVPVTATKSSTARVACKVINKRRDGGTSSYVRKFLPRELDVLRTVRHPNVVRTHRIYVTPNTVHVFMDYCEIGDLLSHLQHVKSIPQWQAHTFFRSVYSVSEILVCFFQNVYFNFSISYGPIVRCCFSLRVYAHNIPCLLYITPIKTLNAFSSYIGDLLVLF